MTFPGRFAQMVRTFQDPVDRLDYCGFYHDPRGPDFLLVIIDLDIIMRREVIEGDCSNIVYAPLTTANIAVPFLKQLIHYSYDSLIVGISHIAVHNGPSGYLKYIQNYDAK